MIPVIAKKRIRKKEESDQKTKEMLGIVFRA